MFLTRGFHNPSVTYDRAHFLRWPPRFMVPMTSDDLEALALLDDFTTGITGDVTLIGMLLTTDAV